MKYYIITNMTGKGEIYYSVYERRNWWFGDKLLNFYWTIEEATEFFDKLPFTPTIIKSK